MKRLIPPYEKHYRFREIAKHVTKPNSRLMDVGCGDATLLRYLDSSIEYYGIDVNQIISMRVVTNHSVYHPLYAQVDITKDAFPFRSDYFDYVVCTEVLEHIDNHQNCLSEIRRVLKPDGILLGTVPNCLAFPRVVSFSETKSKKDAENIVGKNHVVAFGYPEIRDLLNANQFNVLNEYYFYFILSNRAPLSIPVLDRVLKKFCFYIFFEARKR